MINIDVDQLEQIIRQANDEYYNQGASSLTDDQYDSLVDQLKTVRPDSKVLNEVGADVGSQSVPLPVCMGSQTKVRIGESDLTQLFDGDVRVVQMAKLDGLSMLIEYRNGKFNRLLTRGDGYSGQDITARGMLMSFPKHLPDCLNRSEYVYLCGEAVISSANYAKVKGNYKHRRNFVGGTLRPSVCNAKFNDVEDYVKYNCSLIEVVIWDIPSAHDLGIKTLSQGLDILADNGFSVVYHKVINSSKLNDNYAENLIKALKTKYKYLCDGIVIKIDDVDLFVSKGKDANGLNPTGSRAVKLPLEKQDSAVAIIRDIKWEISKRGLFIPVLEIVGQDGNPINLQGRTLTNVSGVNLGYVKANGWHKGSKIVVIFSGDVIPRVIHTFPDNDHCQPDVPSTCPYCGTPLQSTGVSLFCPNRDCCGVTKKQVTAFFGSMKIDNIGETTVSDLYDRGFNSIPKLLTIKYSDLIALPGYQARKALTVSKSLNNCLNNVTLTKLMSFSQCFHNEKTSLSEKRLELIVESLGEHVVLDNLRDKVDDDGNRIKLPVSKLLNTRGLSNTTVELFKKGYVNFKSIFKTIEPYIKLRVSTNIVGKLTGMSFCFTQFRDSDLEQLIISNGGKVGNLTKATTVLFFAGGSTKMDKAIKYQIPTVPKNSAREYVERLLNS